MVDRVTPLEAVAHIEVQKMIDEGSAPEVYPTTATDRNSSATRQGWSRGRVRRENGIVE
jgi:hypothetical protein